MTEHPIPPFYDKDSRILILGSFPSVKSREMMFFYGHPQNRFWRVLAAVYDDKYAETVDERKIFLKKHRIDGTKTVQEYVRKGIIRATVMQEPEKQGYEAIHVGV